MIRTVSLLFSLPTVVAGLLVAYFFGQLGLVGTTLGIVSIICFAVIATSWTEDHDVPD